MSLPYRNLAGYLRERFEHPVIKISVDAGFSCPNRDGTLGVEGCTFCLNASFSPEARRAPRPLAEQIDGGIRAHRRGHPDARFWVYFQPFTNTHAPLDRLKDAYDEALRDDVVVLSIGTRPDAVPDPVLDLLASYAKDREVWLELGLQSVHDATLARVRRRHTTAAFTDALERAKRRGL
ncbi:MAG: tRNA modification radical SAM protein MnmL/YtqA, partial [Planctomycetota bacterium]